ncbi:hypothetical protein CDL15_Pgr027761 [Punica granatum]|uniref:Uncharacterized protein n=1 Tax=Punica granatum TaxID=22663 RepID=A0A218XJ81_PUNGR|nr:hypothetical protein CDL15_Pgr027761 [Punica granatum]
MQITCRNDETGAADRVSGVRRCDMSRCGPGKLPMLGNGLSKAAGSHPGQSPYKLKAMGKIPEEPPQRAGSCTPGPIHPDHSRLLDTYEIKMITKELYWYMESNGSKFHGSFLMTVRADHGQIGNEKSQQQHHDMNNGKEKHKNRTKGLWIRQSVVCGMGAKGAVEPAARPHSDPSNHKARAFGC